MPAAKAKSVETVRHKIPHLNQEFTLRKDINAWLVMKAMRSGDPGAVVDMILGVVVEDERAEFDRAMGSADGMNEQVVIDILSSMYEAVSDGRPTNPSSGSSRTTTTKVVTRRSAAR
jgi:hypothetical protein